MNELIINVFLTIQGIAAASGLIYKDNAIHVISDNSKLLYTYSIPQDKLTTTTLLSGNVLENIPKKEKSDFEAITAIDGQLYVFGSGSAKNRNTLVKYNAKQGTKDSVDLGQVYEKLKADHSVAEQDFNIEGAVYYRDELWLFNRGNGPAKQNGVFILDKQTLAGKAFFHVSLPELEGVSTGFTDATLVDGKIYFIAAAEDSNSSYHDGEVKGTLIGRLDPKSRIVEYTKTLALGHKFEGIAPYRKTKKAIQFLLCEDPDNENNTSTIYKVEVKR
ncbi:DUF6929 family protein [Sphingobacterium deserti]|uniref:Uncharacterized protein n=1 Tax=Sphingobacterium deserti TaxID=1229276 RepID=A0A0B8T9L8_9SPHI|nr:hypothetical protein [Sphingobacterium deserti]KGE14705.1 hypothetical protein DI53_1734 [Sphingobacterium deserti]